MRAYRKAVSDHMEHAYFFGRWPTLQEVFQSAVPDRRTIIMVLLETEACGEYRKLQRKKIRDDNHRPPGAVAYPGSAVGDKERIVEAIGDASTQDGDKSDWSIGDALNQQSRPSVDIATTIDGWSGEFRIDPDTTQTLEGPLDFSDADQETALRFLIDILNRTAESQVK